MQSTRATLSRLQQSDVVAITRTEAAEILGIDIRTVTRAIKDGSIPSVRLGRRVLIPRLPFLAMFGAANE